MVLHFSYSILRVLNIIIIATGHQAKFLDRSGSLLNKLQLMILARLIFFLDIQFLTPILLQIPNELQSLPDLDSDSTLKSKTGIGYKNLKTALKQTADLVMRSTQSQGDGKCNTSIRNATSAITVKENSRGTQSQN